MTRVQDDMRTMPKACAAIGLIAAAVASGDVYARDPSGDADDPCAHYSEALHRESRRLDMTIDNACPVAMRCTVEWTVSCAGAASPGARSAVLPAGGAQTFVASAESCRAEWAIDSQWRCDEVK